LRKIKQDDELKGLGENVTRIRKTQKGDILLQLRKNPAEMPQNYEAAVQKVLGSSATARTLTKEVLVEIRDMDEVTTKDDILQAMKIACGEDSIQGDRIRSLRTSFGGTQSALIKLPVEAANKLINVGN
ncbi:hypothetical protein KR222_010394, partial [Zaprionus bogoriensis]